MSTFRMGFPGNYGADGPRLPDVLARSSPGAPRRGGGLPIDEPGLDVDALDRGEHYQNSLFLNSCG